MRIKAPYRNGLVLINGREIEVHKGIIDVDEKIAYQILKLDGYKILSEKRKIDNTFVFNNNKKVRILICHPNMMLGGGELSTWNMLTAFPDCDIWFSYTRVGDGTDMMLKKFSELKNVRMIQSDNYLKIIDKLSIYIVIYYSHQ